MGRWIADAVNDLTCTAYDQFPIRVSYHGTHPDIVPAEGKTGIVRAVCVVADERPGVLIGSGVDVEKQDVFAVGEKNASGWRSLRGEERRVEGWIQQNRAARRRFWNSTGMFRTRQRKQHRHRCRENQNNCE